MFQSAVFVDAGYLFALGAVALGEPELKRPDLTLDADAAVEALREAVSDFAPESRLLRIYWYDALIRGGQLTADQSRIARMDDVKFRYGVLNSAGRQKGVDSLIITDLIELARNKSISDAILIGGDEDLRAGLQIAQTYGVRVEVVGLAGNERSQSPTLISEADRNRLWTKQQFGKIVGKRATPILAMLQPAPTTLLPLQPMTMDAVVADVIKDVVERIKTGDAVEAIVEHVRQTDSIPPEVDRPALGQLGETLARSLNYKERQTFREKLKSEILGAFTVR